MGRKKLLGLVLFGIAIAALLVGVKIMNFVPAAVQRGALREFATIEEMKTQLKLRDVFVPAYYPQCFRWPPSLVAGQARPFTAVVLGFTRSDGTGICLYITQTALPHRPPEYETAMKRVDRTVPHRLKGRDAVLDIGTCRGGAACSRIAWDEKGYRVTVLMENTPIELIRIAESMVF